MLMSDVDPEHLLRGADGILEMADFCRISAGCIVLATALTAWTSGLAAAPHAENARTVVAQILSDRPISEGLRRPSIGGERLPDMLQRPDTRTDIRPQRRIIMPQNQVCRDEPVFRKTDRGTRREVVRRCYLVPAR
jgi:hypothetical protein